MTVEVGKIEGRFAVIYADPPWRYTFSASSSRKIENQYPTMTLDQICALPIAEATLDDCTLFLWATAPKLKEALQVVGAWGFRYLEHAVWDKEIIGMGYYFRQQTEDLIVATKGKPTIPPRANQPASLIRVRRAQHSEKPEIVYEMIESMYPELFNAGLFLELFQRRPRRGWKGWGNQLFDQTNIWDQSELGFSRSIVFGFERSALTNEQRLAMAINRRKIREASTLPTNLSLDLKR